MFPNNRILAENNSNLISWVVIYEYDDVTLIRENSIKYDLFIIHNR